MSSVVSVSSRAAALVSRVTHLGRSHFGFRIGYRAASVLSAITLAWCVGVVWRRSPSPLLPSLGDEALAGATLSVLVLLLAGLALRIARRRELSARERRGVARGALTALAREAEVATGFVASLIAGTVVAGSPSACDAVAGWFAPVLGLANAGCATATMLVVAAIGTVTTELARRGISRSLGHA